MTEKQTNQIATWNNVLMNAGIDSVVHVFQDDQIAYSGRLEGCSSLCDEKAMLWISGYKIPLLSIFKIEYVFEPNWNCNHIMIILK